MSSLQSPQGQTQEGVFHTFKRARAEQADQLFRQTAPRRDQGSEEPRESRLQCGLV